MEYGKELFAYLPVHLNIFIVQMDGQQVRQLIYLHLVLQLEIGLVLQ
jgi:hypothetical protein